MAAKDGGAVIPRRDNEVANREFNSQQQTGSTGESILASPFGTVKPTGGFLLNSTTIAPPTPAYSQTAPAFGVPSPVGPKVKQERPPLSTGSSFRDTPASATTEDGTPPAKRMKFDFTDILRIDVGPERRRFHVPRKLAISRSPLVANNFQEDQAIVLPNDDPQVFSIWLQIVLQGQVVIDDEETVIDKAQMWSLLVQTYLLAAKLGDVQCMNITVEDIVRRLRQPALGEQPIAQAVKYGFEHTTSESKLRRVFIDFAVYRTTDRNLVSEVQSSDFLSEVVKEFMNWRDIQSPASGWERDKFGEDVRRYHVKDAAGAVKR